jgi:anthranilate phosphoribosyltransferase
MLKPFLAKVINRQNLSLQEAEEAMQIIMTGNATQAQVGGYLVALRMKGETVEEIAGSAMVMRAHAAQIPKPECMEIIEEESCPLLDTAGTGGDGAHTINISTAAAFIIAGAGVRVAKHGNRAASSRCGSADVLEALGVNLDLLPEQVGDCIQQVGIGFLFAPKFHSAMRHVIGPRRELAQRTIFNLLGPLTNPAGATHQLIGVYDARLTEPLAEVLGELCTQAAYVVHGYGGLDELTTAGPNRVSSLRDGKVQTYILDPAEYGLKPASSVDLRGGEPQQNAASLLALLNSEDQSPRQDVVLLNAAQALATRHADLRQGLEEAQRSLFSGAALAKLHGLIEFSHAFATA